MALSATVLRDLIDTKLAAVHPDYAADPDSRDQLKAQLFTAIAEAVVEHLTTAATVSFAAGQITGEDDPTGDTHDALVASGGSIA